MHRETIKLFNQKEHLPLKLYRPWVVYFRQLKELTVGIPTRIETLLARNMREQQLQDLTSISPDKKDSSVLIRLNQPSYQSASKNRGDNRLDELLFSKERDDFLLLSDCKRSNSEKRLSVKDDSDCENCLMMKWEVSKVREDAK